MGRFESLLKGRMLGGRYLVQALLGRGGMGAVFRAHDEHLERLVALKVLSFPDDVGDEENLRRRFRREAKVAAGLKHHNVVAIHDRGVDAELDLDYLVMELLSGRDLAQHLVEHGPPPTALAVAWMRQAARGLAAGHRAGLIHRDIKPANLFVAEEDGEDTRVVVLDFGIALPSISDRTLTRLTVADRGPLTPPYAAPEQLSGTPVTPACDVFSLAATAFELITGVPVARPNEPAGSAAAIARARGELARRSSLPPGLGEVLGRALSPKPQDRYRDAGELAAALAGLNTDRPGGTGTETRPLRGKAAGNRGGGRIVTMEPPDNAESYGVGSLRNLLAAIAALGSVGLSLWFGIYILDRADPFWGNPPPEQTDLLYFLVAGELSLALLAGWITASIAARAARARAAKVLVVLWIIPWLFLAIVAGVSAKAFGVVMIPIWVVALGGCLCALVGARMQRASAGEPWKR